VTEAAQGSTVAIRHRNPFISAPTRYYGPVPEHLTHGGDGAPAGTLEKFLEGKGWRRIEFFQHFRKRLGDAEYCLDLNKPVPEGVAVLPWEQLP
jgi:hypothetical protein